MSTPHALGHLASLLLTLLIRAILTAPLWPLYGLARLFARRPPCLPSPGRSLEVLRRILTERPDPPLPLLGRPALLAEWACRFVFTPLIGLCWILDDVIYGRQLAATPLEAPLFELSAARSGSTQLAHYLEDDPHLVAPSVLYAVFPYLWLWRLADRIFFPWFSRERLARDLLRRMPREYLERHEMDPWRTDTFEVLFLTDKQMGDLLFRLGSSLFSREMSPELVQPGTEVVWQQDFLDFIDAIGRKTLLYRGPQPDGQPRRFMLKGHFLNVADALERRYPDATFLTVVRDPLKRMQSVVNFHHVQPMNPVCRPMPWAWLTETALLHEPAYCERERAWFLREGGARRIVVRFSDYVRDLPGTMELVYREALGLEQVSPHVPREHAPRVRSNYTHDRSLEDLGVDVPALRARLHDYTQWCEGRGAATDRGAR